MKSKKERESLMKILKSSILLAVLLISANLLAVEFSFGPLLYKPIREIRLSNTVTF
jgi:hypothetical protein